MIDRNAEPEIPEDDPLDAGLRAAFSPETTSDPWGGSVLTALRESSGPTPSIRLWDEPDEGPTGVVDPWSPEAAAVASGPARAPGDTRSPAKSPGAGSASCSRAATGTSGREVALKVLRAEHVANPTMVRRLVEEAQIGGQLQHPGILPVYELGLDSAWRPFFAMKLVRGRTLAALLDERGDPSRDRRRFLAIFEQICQTMAYAHARGVIHRDLKPSNVMVGAFGEVQVVDWGLAKVLARGGSGRRPGLGGPGRRDRSAADGSPGLAIGGRLGARHARLHGPRAGPGRGRGAG